MSDQPPNAHHSFTPSASPNRSRSFSKSLMIVGAVMLLVGAILFIWGGNTRAGTYTGPTYETLLLALVVGAGVGGLGLIVLSAGFVAFLASGPADRKPPPGPAPVRKIDKNPGARDVTAIPALPTIVEDDEGPPSNRDG